MTERLYLPKKIKVGGINFDIVHPAVRNNGSMEIGLFGLCDQEAAKIFLFTNIAGFVPPTTKIIDVLLHELIHAVDEVWLGSILEEEEVNRIGRGLYQVLVDNDLDSHPDQVKVAGMVYDINYVDYNLDDGEKDNVISSCNVITNEIFIRWKGENSCDYNKQVIEVNIIRSVLLAMAYEYSFSQETNEKINIETLSHGIHQLLVDNNIANIVRKYCR